MPGFSNRASRPHRAGVIAAITRMLRAKRKRRRLLLPWDETSNGEPARPGAMLAVMTNRLLSTYPTLGGCEDEFAIFLPKRDLRLERPAESVAWGNFAPSDSGTTTGTTWEIYAASTDKGTPGVLIGGACVLRPRQILLSHSHPQDYYGQRNGQHGQPGG